MGERASTDHSGWATLRLCRERGCSNIFGNTAAWFYAEVRDHMTTFTVVYERDEAGWWVAEVPSISGCHTQGRTIEEARERILEVLTLYVSEGARILLREEARLPEHAA